MSQYPDEVYFRHNTLAYDRRTNATSIAQTLGTLFPAIPSAAKKSLKTVFVTNYSSSLDVHYGQANSVTDALGGGIIRRSTTKEFPLGDITASPFFIAAGANVDIGLELWT